MDVSIPNRDWEKLQLTKEKWDPYSLSVSIPNRDWEKLQQ